VASIILAGSLAGCSGKDGGEGRSPEGAASAADVAPDFSLPDLRGNTVKFSDYRGKVVLVDFWATWCPPCKMEIPHLVELYDEYRGEGFEIIGIALDRSGAAAVEPFVREHNINYSVVIGNANVANAFGGLTAIPTAFLVDRSGNIVRKYVGYQTRPADVPCSLWRRPPRGFAWRQRRSRMQPCPASISEGGFPFTRRSRRGR